jgi:hypothetical protein
MIAFVAVYGSGAHMADQRPERTYKTMTQKDDGPPGTRS